MISTLACSNSLNKQIKETHPLWLILWRKCYCLLHTNIISRYMIHHVVGAVQLLDWLPYFVMIWLLNIKDIYTVMNYTEWFNCLINTVNC